MAATAARKAAPAVPAKKGNGRRSHIEKMQAAWEAAQRREEKLRRALDKAGIEHPDPKGRPAKMKADDATLQTLKGLGLIDATTWEGACSFEVDEKTFLDFLQCNKSAREAFEYGRGKGNVSLRRKQYEVANIQGNVSMLIWLGKQRLEQRDAVELDDGPNRRKSNDQTQERFEALLAAVRELEDDDVDPPPAFPALAMIDRNAEDAVEVKPAHATTQ